MSERASYRNPKTRKLVGGNPERVVQVTSDQVVTTCGNQRITYYGVQGRYRVGDEIAEKVKSAYVTIEVMWSPWDGVPDDD
jgi:hypothetical protein